MSMYVQPRFEKGWILLQKKAVVGRKRMMAHEWFIRSGKRLHKHLHLIWLYWHKMPVSRILGGLNINSKTVCKWTPRLRRHCGDVFLREERLIGGKGFFVEVGETKIGKRKYNRGCRVDCVWVIVGIERPASKRFFLLLM